MSSPSSVLNNMPSKIPEGKQVADRDFRTLRWRRHVPPTRRMTFNGLHIVKFQKMNLFKCIPYLNFSSQNLSQTHPRIWITKGLKMDTQTESANKPIIINIISFIIISLFLHELGRTWSVPSSWRVRWSHHLNCGRSMFFFSSSCKNLSVVSLSEIMNGENL
jgi:hypothetical protein